MKTIFINVAFSEAYVTQQRRMIESIKAHYINPDLLIYTDKYPNGSRRMSKSMYGFKVHAIKEAINKGYERIIYLDSAMILKDTLDFYFDLCPKHGVVAIQDDSKLPASDKALKWFGYTRDQIKDFHLVGGSLFVFDMKYSKPVFDMWYNAEVEGLFGSQDDESFGRLQGHRHDETCLALSLYKNGFTPLPYAGSRYNWDTNPAIIKDHFK